MRIECRGSGGGYVNLRVGGRGGEAFGGVYEVDSRNAEEPFDYLCDG